VAKHFSLQKNQWAFRPGVVPPWLLVFATACASGMMPVVAANAPKAAEGRTVIARRYADLPLAFEKNEGQFSPQDEFEARGDGYRVFLTQDGAELFLRGQESGAGRRETGNRRLPIVHHLPGRTTESGPQTTDWIVLAWKGANSSAHASGVNELSGKVNYLLGRDSSRWRTNVPLYSKVEYADVYPGIGLVFHGNQRRLEFDFVLEPGADANAIRLGIGARNSKFRVDENGDLIIQQASGLSKDRARSLNSRGRGQGPSHQSKIQNPKSKISRRPLRASRGRQGRL
jgi:hypothetical protein